MRGSTTLHEEASAVAKWEWGTDDLCEAARNFMLAHLKHQDWYIHREQEWTWREYGHLAWSFIIWRKVGMLIVDLRLVLVSWSEEKRNFQMDEPIRPLSIP